MSQKRITKKMLRHFQDRIQRKVRLKERPMLRPLSEKQIKDMFAALDQSRHPKR